MDSTENYVRFLKIVCPTREHAWRSMPSKIAKLLISIVITTDGTRVKHMLNIKVFMTLPNTVVIDFLYLNRPSGVSEGAPELTLGLLDYQPQF